MARLNKNNFLIWDGFFDEIQISIIAVDDQVSGELNEKEIFISPLANDSATYGIDASSFIVLTHDNPAKPPLWNPTTRVLTYYPPENTQLENHVVTYRFKDSNGNPSNVGNIFITLLKPETYWKAFESSWRCIQGPEGNTGMLIYDQLQEFYLNTNSPVEPISLKSNSIEDPDYIAPVENLNQCPLQLSQGTYFINNYSRGFGNATVLNVAFYREDNTLIKFISMDVQPNQSDEFEGPVSNDVKRLRIGLGQHSGSETTNHEVILNGVNRETGTNTSYYFFENPELKNINYISVRVLPTP